MDRSVITIAGIKCFLLATIFFSLKGFSQDVSLALQKTPKLGEGATPLQPNMDGFLRWAYKSWPQTPLADSRFTAWPAGDTYQFYPGPLSSIRFEKLMEGIQDFER